MDEINIPFEDILEQVKMLASYVGAKRDDDPSAYERIMITKNETEMLKGFFMSAGNDIGIVLSKSPKIINCNFYNTGVIIDVASNHSNIKSSTIVGIIQAIKDYCVYYMLTRWFMIVNKSEAEVYAKTASDALLRIDSLLKERDLTFGSVVFTQNN